MKRVLSAILASLLVAFTIPAYAYSSGGYTNGDVDKNGSIDVNDATVIQKYIVETIMLDSQAKLLADVNLDGYVNIFDATTIQKVLADIIPLPQEPTTAPPTTVKPTAQPTTAKPTTQPTTAQPTTVKPTTAPTTAPATEPTAPNPKVSSSVKIAFTNNMNWSKVYFYLYNSTTGAQAKSWPGTQVTTYTTNSYGEKVYNSTVNVDTYDRVIFNNGSGQQTVNVAVTKASSGFYISDSNNKSAMLVGTYALTGGDGGTIKTTSLKYPTGYNKKIWIWTPADYSATSAQKYRTVYIMDGQNLFDDDHQDSFGGWEVTDAVESMMSNGGRGVIIVGIDNSSGNRDSELTPDIGQVVPAYRNEFSNRTGIQFSDFVVNTVMPYVQKNYNSSKAAVDNCIAGSSSGGLEAFYIGMEHRDKFGQIGALSPAFLLFSSSTWQSYLSKYNFKAADMPRLYIFNGNGDFENELYPDTLAMYNRLVGYGYSSSKLKFSVEDNFAHNEAYWRIIFPEMLAWCLDI